MNTDNSAINVVRAPSSGASAFAKCAVSLTDVAAVPAPHYYSPMSRAQVDQLQRQGLAFSREDFASDQDFETFLNTGVVSSEREMIIVFCDIKGSTVALREGGYQAFRALQSDVLACFDKAVRGGNEYLRGKATERRYPRTVIDKIMGDCVMFYVDLGDSKCSADLQARRYAAETVVRVIDDVVSHLSRDDTRPDHSVLARRVGFRFGVALGGKIMLSVLGGGPGEVFGGDFTVTGEAVNIAARLEHATTDEFLGAIARRRRQAAPYTDTLWDREGIRSSRLANELLELDRQVAEIYEMSRSRFEIRANREFVDALGSSDDGYEFAWRQVPFEPRGFEGAHAAFLLGGDNVHLLLRRV